MDVPDFIKSLDFLLEVAHHSGNDRAFVRSLNKTTRHAIDKTIRLSQPVDGREFVRWVNETASRTLSRDQQAKLGAMTAQSGSIENLTHLLNLRNMTMPGISTRCAFGSAALVPNERICALLLQHNATSGDLAAAAAGGSRAICEEILRVQSRVFADVRAAGAAASRGQLADWLCTVIPGTDMCNLIVGAAKGCDLSTLQRLYREQFRDKVGDMIAAAAGSTTPDWLAKVDWLETVIDRRINKKSDVYSTALLSGPDWLARLEALRARDYPIDGDVVGHAARVGNTRPLEYILSFYNFPADTLSRHYRKARGLKN
ncbi:hypothetical protein TSOC_013066 [Tetrabaena socialis]|uniref:Uncharacterized protein n=1 Tax=Tetrabaena socialis TaxID=47790 RepID=A0A2J7ZLD0_9CHLO|nr:hypothetical protein TSOC_013066 [Tetrabaena socialis]|eukprot:PNH01071.1 hypothetical protein TSOC_013066 [Tetrabaena socialis]